MSFLRHTASIKNYSLVLLLLLIAYLCRVYGIAEDKVLHTTVSMAISTLLVVMWPRLKPWAWYAMALTTGLAKELWDMQPGGSGFSMYDLGADLLGVVLGIWLIQAVFDYYHRHFKR